MSDYGVVYTTPEAAQLLGTTTSNVRTYLKQGKLVGFKLTQEHNSQWYITEDSLAKLLENPPKRGRKKGFKRNKKEVEQRKHAHSLVGLLREQNSNLMSDLYNLRKELSRLEDLLAEKSKQNTVLSNRVVELEATQHKTSWWKRMFGGSV